MSYDQYEELLCDSAYHMRLFVIYILSFSLKKFEGILILLPVVKKFGNLHQLFKLNLDACKTL